MSVHVELTQGEAAAIADHLFHSPTCVWSHQVVGCYVDDAGVEWADSTLTVPYVTPACTCGYFDLRESAIAKVTDALKTQAGFSA